MYTVRNSVFNLMANCELVNKNDSHIAILWGIYSERRSLFYIIRRKIYRIVGLQLRKVWRLKVMINVLVLISLEAGSLSVWLRGPDGVLKAASPSMAKNIVCHNIDAFFKQFTFWTLANLTHQLKWNLKISSGSKELYNITRNCVDAHTNKWKLSKYSLSDGVECHSNELEIELSASSTINCVSIFVGVYIGKNSCQSHITNY